LERNNFSIKYAYLGGFSTQNGKYIFGKCAHFFLRGPRKKVKEAHLYVLVVYALSFVLKAFFTLFES